MTVIHTFTFYYTAIVKENWSYWFDQDKVKVKYETNEDECPMDKIEEAAKKIIEREIKAYFHECEIIEIETTDWDDDVC